jgi:hypothetical protein
MPSFARDTQYIRCSELVVRLAEGGEITIANLRGRDAIRMHFEVARTFSPTENKPQTATIELYNLAEDTRHQLEGIKGILAPTPSSWSLAQLLASDADRGYDGPDAVVAKAEPPPGAELPANQLQASHKYGYGYVYLRAGYDGKVGQIFEGTVLIPESRRADRTTWVTTLSAGDGSLGASKGVANKSFNEGTATLTIVRHLLRLLGVGVGNVTEESWQRILAAGQREAAKPYSTSSTIAWSYSPSGQSAWADLALLLQLSNVKWVIDQGDFYLLEPDGYVLGAPVDLGRPIGDIQDAGGGLFRGTFPLNQNARPAGKVTVDSRKFPGEWVAQGVYYSGDTHEGGFTTTVEFRAIDPLGLGL